MAYSEEKKQECFDWIIENIKEGKSLRWCLDTNNMPSSRTFYKWLEEKDEKGNLTEEAQEKVKQYTRACETREELLADQILLIADDQEGDIYKNDDGVELTNHNVIQRSKVRIEARMWLLGKLNPKKYGNKIDHTTNGEKINVPILSFDPLSSNESDNGIT